MNPPVFLVGASGLAREVMAAGMPCVRGILDDRTDLQGTVMAGVPVVGTVEDAALLDESLLICVGSGARRRDIARRLAKVGVTEDRFATFVAGSARIGATSTVGAGTVVLDGVVVTAAAALGRHVVVMPNCTITHDDVLEDFATLAAGVALGGSVRVREAAYIGMNAAVREAVVIGADTTIGMGSVVLDAIPDGQTWVGVPARQLGVTA